MEGQKQMLTFHCTTSSVPIVLLDHQALLKKTAFQLIEIRNTFGQLLLWKNAEKTPAPT